MADLPPYERRFSFTGFQANNPRDPLPGQQLDRELDDIADHIGVFGKSAYEIAVLNGFQGTVGEWLLSLAGPPGRDSTVPGPPGQGGEAVASGIAGAAVPAHKIVRVASGKLLLARCDDLSHFGRVVGMSVTAASDVGDPLTYVAGGQVAEGLWQWDVGPVYLGIDGNMTQAPPQAGFIQQIGIAQSATQIMVDLQPPIIIA